MSTHLGDYSLYYFIERIFNQCWASNIVLFSIAIELSMHTSCLVESKLVQINALQKHL
jgi:hypothetical protein